MLNVLLDVSLARLLQCSTVAILGCYLLTIVRRLYFHPLAQIPGPKLAAATLLYQTYYSFAGGRSRFYQKVAKLHEKYGKIVPLARCEWHINQMPH